jgi:threonine dehydratase
VGIQVPHADKKAMKTFLDQSIYPWFEETDHPAYRLFL